MSSALTRLGTLSVRRFLARNWQRRPVLIRQAIAGFRSPVTRSELFELAQHEEVESRLIVDPMGVCRLCHGPFARRQLPPLRQGKWTLLVQGVDQHVPAADELVRRFRFIADARLDDLMVSYASDGGGVGPHVDSYDVFLLQAAGRRRWRIQTHPDPTCVEQLPIQRLARFQPDAEWVLEPGDMLYLPPGIAHDGVAQGECMTCSIGFRTPSWGDLANIWTELQAGHAAARPATYRDPGVSPNVRPARLPSRMIAAAVHELSLWRPSRQDVAAALLRQLSEPKPRVVFKRPQRPLGRAAFEAALRLRGLRVDRRTRLLYSGRSFAINGELFHLSDLGQRAWMTRFADRRATFAAGRDRAPDSAFAPLIDCLFQWYLAGWVLPPQ